MSLKYRTYLVCDGHLFSQDCPIDGGEFNGTPCYSEIESGNNQREEARLFGWTHHLGKDFCGACSERMRKEAEEQQHLPPEQVREPDLEPITEIKPKRKYTRRKTKPTGKKRPYTPKKTKPPVARPKKRGRPKGVKSFQ